MKLKSKLFALLLLLTVISVYGQMEKYDYKREIKGISGQWHKLTLPDALFSKVSADLSDLRVVGINPAGDTIEAPFLLKRSEEKTMVKEVDFRIVNTSHNEKGYYYTLEIPTKEPVNQIKLEFKQQNFDWKTTLEGSQDQKEWFTIAEEYRILSIKNSMTDFEFTKIAFPDAAYRYFRLHIASNEKPDLLGAKVWQQEVSEGAWKNYPIQKMKVIENKQDRQSEIEIDLPSRVPVSYLKIHVKDSFDYYRPVTIEYLSDSIHTEQGWKFSYQILSSGTLNSLEDNEFKFNSTLLKKIRVLIGNQDNQPLSIGTVEVKGTVHELAIRFTKEARYFLLYGNDQADFPQYDIAQFTDKIPAELPVLEVGDEQRVDKKRVSGTSPLFQHEAWLWVIMGVIIALLGWFTLRMMRKK
ncbi:MAG TPA: DUF3999 family protein [Prolixibacteraceae bacterium]|nr:DUF3999 family protein [Prolixibacteraceae bacterium]